MPSCGVRRPSVCLSVCKLFAQIASSTRQIAGSPPNLHTMVPRRACIQGVLKVKVEVKGHVIRALSFWHENRFFSQANGWIVTKLAHDGPQMGLHPGCAQDRIATKLAHDCLQMGLHPGCAQGQGRGPASRDTGTYDFTKIASSPRQTAES